MTYADIGQQYVDYMRSHYNSKRYVAFDGYGNGPNIKDHEHVRRAGASAPDVVFDFSKTIYHDQSSFLANERNKKKIVAFLMICLQHAGFVVDQAVDDADTLIVKCALQLAEQNPVIVVSNDTDVFVLLVSIISMLNVTGYVTFT